MPSARHGFAPVAASELVELPRPEALLGHGEDPVDQLGDLTHQLAVGLCRCGQQLDLDVGGAPRDRCHRHPSVIGDLEVGERSEGLA